MLSVRRAECWVGRGSQVGRPGAQRPGDDSSSPPTLSPHPLNLTFSPVVPAPHPLLGIGILTRFQRPYTSATVEVA